MSRLLTGLTSGMIAGAAGSTALNTWSYTQQALNGQPSSATPDQAAQAVIQSVGGEVPGTPAQRAARLEGLGPLSGLGVGLGLGALGGLLRAVGIKIPIAVAPVVLGLGAMAVSDGVMTVVGITEPRTWTPKSMLQDAVPHLVYGAVTVLALHRMIDPDTMQVR